MSTGNNVSAQAATLGRILIVDDEEDLVRLVAYNLNKAGFKTVSAFNGKEALSLSQSEQPDIIILDLMLPDLSGVKICQRLKESNTTRHIPIIMLTARSSEDDRITGFEAGADDYVVKPFSPKELVLRVKALMTRTQASATYKKNKAPVKSEPLQIGPLCIYPDDHLVECDGLGALSLTNLEFQIFLCFAEAPNRVRTREQLIEAVWHDGGEDLSDRTVDTHIKRLRKKLGAHKEMIETIRGVGYRMTTEQKNAQPEAAPLA